MVIKSIVLYGCHIKLSNAHKPVHGTNQPPYYVRMKEVQGDMAHALDKAKPLPGETVLNTVELVTEQVRPAHTYVA